MSDPRMPRDQPAGDGELLSAYLDGELDPGATAMVEARLADDTEFAARLERTREVVETLAGLHATPPAGYRERLAARLAGERAGPAAGDVVARAGDGRAAAGTAPRGPRAASGPGRTRGRRRWMPAFTAAAGVLVLGLLGGAAVLGGLLVSGQSDEMASGDAAFDEAGTADDGAARLFSDEADDAEEAEPLPDDLTALDTPEELPDEPVEEADRDWGVASGLPGGQPLLVEDGAVLDDGDAAAAHLSRRAVAVELLGMGVDDAEEVALAYRVVLQRAPAFSTGVEPDHCLDEVTTGSAGPAVPVLVEQVSFEGQDALAYVVATASSGSDVLDRLEGWVVDADACATRLFTPLRP